jgi:transposase
MGYITKLNDQASLAKYIGLTWRKKQSGDFTAQDTYLTKTGNKYLRYYILEATDSSLRFNSECTDYYHKKYNETLTHKHKR